MFRFFKRRGFLVFVGFVLLAAFIWLFGPYFAFADYHPLESVAARLWAIALSVGVWAGWRILRRLRAYRASDRLVAAVVQQSVVEDKPSAEATQLRERFEEAINTLKTTRRSGHSLYELPWYLIIGAPGSGKTTALMNSGLKFPLEQRVGKGALRGVGGTRNCDWWFTDEAVFLDTAGRYTTQDSDAASDSKAWMAFLGLLKKYRGRRPINGIILTVSAHDLMVQGQRGREAHVEAARRRLEEANRELNIQLPVYLMVTKCDLAAGFTEYFDDLTQDGRAQVWGVTFPYEQTASGEAPQQFPAEFDALVARLNARVFARIEEERDVARRARIFAFPQQMAALRDVLTQFVSDVFGSTTFDRRILLRGVYFTSGTQEGTPIDRLLGAIGRRFGVAAEAVAAGGRGKAFFVERLLKEVIIGESGLAGVNRRVEARKAAVQIGAYAAMALIGVLGFIALSVGFGRNRGYVADVEAAVQKLEATPPTGTIASLEAPLPRLDAIRSIVDTADRYRGNVPWGMRWGLYQGSAIGNAARDAYVRELNSVLLPRVAGRIRDRLGQFANEPEKLWEYLKAYVMLGEPRHLDRDHLAFIADLEWSASGQATPESVKSLGSHFRALLEYADALRPIALDASLLARARSTIRQESMPGIMYNRLKREYAGDTARAVPLDVAGGLAVENVLRRKSGISLADPIPAIYSAAVFKEATGPRMIELVKQFAGDAWVLGDDTLAANNPLKLAEGVTNIYEQDYIRAWEAVLDDLELVPFATVTETARQLETLSAPSSPLRAILSTIVVNTTLVDQQPAKEEAPQDKGIRGRIGELFKDVKKEVGLSRPTPGALVTANFQSIHRAVAGDDAPLNRVLAMVREIGQQLSALGPQVGSQSSLATLTSPVLRDSLRALHQEAAALPPPLDALFTQIGSKAEGSVITGATTELERRYQDDVLRDCLEIVEGRYPFTPTGTSDVPLADFGRLFGYEGIFDQFFNTYLAPLVDTSRSPWTWRPGAVRPSRDILGKFEEAARVREMFFRRGSRQPQVQFTVTLDRLESSASRFQLEVDGQLVLDSRAPNRATRVEWPGPGAGLSAATFEDNFGIRHRLPGYGPWGWFRLFDSSHPRQESDVRYTIHLATSGYSARVIVDTATIRNPLTDRSWQRFRCTF